MTKRRNALYYDLSLPLFIRVPSKRKEPAQIGRTRYISERRVYFTTNNAFSTGAKLNLSVTLPIEVTRRVSVFLRAIGKVVHMDKRSTNGIQSIGIVAAVKRWNIVRDTKAIEWRRNTQRIEATPRRCPISLLRK